MCMHFSVPSLPGPACPNPKYVQGPLETQAPGCSLKMFCPSSTALNLPYLTCLFPPGTRTPVPFKVNDTFLKGQTWKKVARCSLSSQVTST